MTDMETEFNRLRDQWKEETLILSSTTAIEKNPNYQQIIAMGKEVIPLILNDLYETHSLWFGALEALTGVNPVPKEKWGYISAMIDIWLQWGEENGFRVS